MNQSNTRLNLWGRIKVTIFRLRHLFWSLPLVLVTGLVIAAGSSPAAGRNFTRLIGRTLKGCAENAAGIGKAAVIGLLCVWLVIGLICWMERRYNH